LIVGSDHALKHQLYRKLDLKCLCVHRPGDGEELQEIIRNPSLNKNSNFVMVPFEGQDLSSTLVRKLIRNGDWNALSNILPDDVCKELKERWNSIFSKQRK